MISFLIKIWGLARPYRARLFLGVLTGVIAGFMEPLAIATFTFVFQLIFTPPASSTFTTGQIKDLPALTVRLQKHPDAVSTFLVERFSPASRQKLAGYPGSGLGTNLMQKALVAELNVIIQDQDPVIYDAQRFAGVPLSPPTLKLLTNAPTGEQAVRLNRLLLEDSFPKELAQNRSFLRAQLKGAPEWLLDRVPQPVWHWFDSVREALESGARTHPWAVIALVAAIPFVMILRGLFSYLNIYLLQWVAIRAITDLRIRLFGHLMNLPAAFFNKNNTGELMARIMNDTTALQGIISNATAVVVKDPATLIGLMAYLLWNQPRLTLISMVVMPLCVIPILIYGRKVRRTAGAMQTHYAELSTVMSESFTSNRIIKAYNLEDTVIEQFRSTARKLVGQTMRIVRAMEIPGPLMEIFGALGVALVFLYLAFQRGDRAGYADFLGLLLAIFSMYRPLKNLARLQNNLEQARAASARVFELLATESTIPEPANPKPLRAAGEDIRFVDIDFAFGEKPVLQQINLTVKAGQFVALVGFTGSGKTTLTNLLLRFYDPQHGSVRIGDTDIRDVTSQDLRSQIAVVTQETVLFNESIRRNIELGRPGATQPEIEAAARHAYAHEYIVEKPEGYDTIVGERGVTLSGGQRQRLAIARAIVRDAPILILDEATNSLDPEVESIVQAALEELMQGRTTICIAHRFSTVQKADMIAVLDQGHIVETGKHAELLALNGVYRRLHDLQFRDEPPPSG